MPLTCSSSIIQLIERFSRLWGTQFTLPLGMQGLEKPALHEAIKLITNNLRKSFSA